MSKARLMISRFEQAMTLVQLYQDNLAIKYLVYAISNKL